MRIGVVAPPWAPIPPVHYGGIEVVVDELVRGYAAAGHDVILYATGDSEVPVARAATFATAVGDRIGHALPEAVHVLDAYDTLTGCDIVHDHTLLGPLLAPPGVRVVTTAHGPFTGEWAAIYRRIAARATVVCISHAQAASAPADVGVGPVIHHGLDARRFPVGTGQPGHALFLGRMSPDKGPHRALAAARGAGVPIVIAAKMRTGEEHEYFETFVAPELGPDAVFVGEVGHEEKLRLLGEARALLFPIEWDEPFGLVMTEALACGTPVVASPRGAAPEVVEHGVTGFLTESVDEMAAALGKIDSIDRAACRAAVTGHFSAARMVADHLALFERLAG